MDGSAIVDLKGFLRCGGTSQTGMVKKNKTGYIYNTTMEV